MPINPIILTIEKEHQYWLDKSLDWWIRSWKLKNEDKQIAELYSKKYINKALQKTKELIEFLESENLCLRK